MGTKDRQIERAALTVFSVGRIVLKNVLGEQDRRPRNSPDVDAPIGILGWLGVLRDQNADDGQGDDAYHSHGPEGRSPSELLAKAIRRRQLRSAAFMPVRGL
jgi:hypothetical protein